MRAAMRSVVKPEIRSVDRGICPIGVSITTETVISVRRGNFG